MRKDYQKTQRDGQPTAEDRALEKFTDLMIDKLQNLQQDWQKPWFTESALAVPRNLNGRQYNGMNSVMLMMHCQKNNYELPVFCTFDRVASLNYTKDKQGARQQVKDEQGENLPQVSVKKGEKSFPVFITTFTVVNKETRIRSSTTIISRCLRTNARTTTFTPDFRYIQSSMSGKPTSRRLVLTSMPSAKSSARVSVEARNCEVKYCLQSMP